MIRRRRAWCDIWQEVSRMAVEESAAKAGSGRREAWKAVHLPCCGLESLPSAKKSQHIERLEPKNC
jgi:hypothetical protein